jgi:drug/metabolite transporter (DMT)-like permease
VVGWLLISASLPRLPAANTSVLLTVQPIGSVALAALIFSENPSALQLAGVALVLVALVVASRSRGRGRVRAASTDTGAVSVEPVRARTRLPARVQRAQEP